MILCHSFNHKPHILCSQLLPFSLMSYSHIKLNVEIPKKSHVFFLKKEIKYGGNMQKTPTFYKLYIGSIRNLGTRLKSYREQIKNQEPNL